MGGPVDSCKVTVLASVPAGTAGPRPEHKTHDPIGTEEEKLNHKVKGDNQGVRQVVVQMKPRMCGVKLRFEGCGGAGVQVAGGGQQGGTR